MLVAPTMAHFRAKNRVEFHQTDVAGIVHFSEFFRYFEIAEHAMYRSLGLSVHDPGAGIGWPRVSCAFDFLRPMGFEDEFEVAISIERLGGSSLTLSCEILLPDGGVAAKGRSTSVCCRRTDDGGMERIPIPDGIRAKLESLML